MILAVGNINMDWICQVEHLPAPDEKVNITQLDIHPGGAASNFAVSLARLGSDVALFGYVGDDDEGRKALEVLAKEKVNTKRVKRAPKFSTGFVLVLAGEEGQSMKMRYRGANAQLSSEDITPALMKDITLTYGASITIPIAERIAEVCAELAIKSAIDIGSDLLTQPKEKVIQLIQKFTMAFMNEVVFEQIVGAPPIVKNIPTLMGGNLEVLNVTCGSKGSFVATPSEVLHAPIFRVEAVDTTGAGDAYAAGFIHFYQKQFTLKEVMRRATACAALQITQYGGRAGLPSEQEIEAFMAAHDH